MFKKHHDMTSMQNTWKTDFALFDIICYDIAYDVTFHTIWHLKRRQYDYQWFEM